MREFAIGASDQIEADAQLCDAAAFKVQPSRICQSAARQIPTDPRS